MTTSTIPSGAPDGGARDARAGGGVLRRLVAGDHRTVAIAFLWLALFFLFAGGLLALYVRWQLGFPGTAVPMPFRLLLPPALAPGGIIGPDGFNAIFTMHATFMIYFAILPLLVGAFANWVIPKQIGASRTAYPRLAALSFWVTLASGLVMIASFLVAGGPAASGWTAYPPLAGVAAYTNGTLGQDLWIVALIGLGMALVAGGVNQVATIVLLRAPGMTYDRLPMTTWSFLVTGVLTVLALPVLAAALSMLLMDRTAGTSFFLPAGLTVSGDLAVGRAGGGQPLMWQHLFWFFGHPVVYIMILPAMGIVSDMLAVFARKPLFGYRAMIGSTIAIALLGWLVWGHHMFQSGMNPLLGSTFMFSTMAIAVPSGMKVFGWLATLWRGQIHFATPMLFALAFVFTFTVGGLTGIFMASTPVDAYIHDSYFIVGHIHYVLFGGSLFAVFAGIAYWFPRVTGRMLGARLGAVHFWITFVAFNATFFPMHILGIAGHMRRIYDPSGYAHLAGVQPINTFITVSAITLGFAQLLFVANIFRSFKRGIPAGVNPWRATTLEWSTSPSAEAGSAAQSPIVYRGPYEYSPPNATEDFLPQDLPIGGDDDGRGVRQRE